jgi:hypothetical protein
LNARIKLETRKRSQLQKNDILEGGRAIAVGGVVGYAVGGAAGGGAALAAAEKGAEVGLVAGGPAGVVVGAAVGAAAGFFVWWGYKKMTTPKEEEYKIQVDMYTGGPAGEVGDPSPLNLLQEVQRRGIEIDAINEIDPIHALGEDAKQWYYLARLGRYCWIQRGQGIDPGEHRLAAKCAYDIAIACHMNLGEFQWP